MRSMIINLWLVCFLCSCILAVNAATHYLVPTNTGAINPYTSWGTAGTSVIDVVNAAMTNSSSPRIIQVSNGVYVLTNTVTITNNVTLQSVNGRDVTIFDGNAGLVSFDLNHTYCVLDGLTITNCYNGGIILKTGTVTNCLITGCVRNGSGGGIYFQGTGIVANSIIRGNLTTNANGSGGGIALNDNSDSSIINCIIEKNECLNGGSGGGINLGSIVSSKTMTTIRNCLIRHNVTTNGNYYGGGLYMPITNAHVVNCTIVSNIAKTAGGGIAFTTAGQTNTVLNCIIQSNECVNTDYFNDRNLRQVSGTVNSNAVAYSCSTSNNMFMLNGRGNTTNDPGFTSFTGENYRFNRYSPCFNSGTNQMNWMNSAVDLDGQTRIRHGRVDMGAYELFIPEGTMFRGR